MHPCLRVPELLTHIFHFTNPDPQDSYKPGTSHLPPSNSLSLALICPTFLEPGLDLVWQEIPSIDSFKNCLPPRNTPPSSSDWDKFSYYARRVRRFGFSPFGNFGSHKVNNPEILSQLALSHPLSKILPNLLELHVYDRDILDMLDFFVGARLKKLYICDVKTSRTARMPAAFGQIQSRCTYLVRFTIMNCRLSTNEAAALSKMANQFTSLRMFQWSQSHPDCPEDTITHVSSLESLESVHISCPPSPIGFNRGSAGHRFDALRDFGVMVSTLDDFSTRLAAVTSTRLSTIDLGLYFEPAASQVKDALAGIRDRVAAAPISSVDLENLSDLDQDMDDGVPLPAHTIEPLLSLRNLLQLRLCFHRPLDVDDDLLKTMATAWPRLQTLELIHDAGMLVPAKVTLGGLISLALHFTELTECALLVDATTLSADSLTRPPGRYTSPLRRFAFGHSPITDPFRVAGFLSDLFPELALVSSSGMHGLELEQAWENVNASVTVLSEVRKQERMFPVLTED
ncbi:hypothetical protein B0H11DRAFT_804258 [Mycena galericulata]|nr:hypothetical protein B0H11DRAFT_804258 [Mycena galericulata]